MAKLEKKRQAGRVNNYAKYVKEVYWPQVSDAKRK